MMAIRKNKSVNVFLLMAALPSGAQAAASVDQAAGTSAAPHSVSAERAPTMALGGGAIVGPLYEGSSRYGVLPLLVAKAVIPTQDWGTFTAAFPEGLRWDLPGASSLGLALLAGYDFGRKEKIRTLGGSDSHLRGMGDLDGTAMVGAEAYWRLSAGKLFVRGWQAARSRDYGGDDLGHTAYLEAGASGSLPLSSTVTLDSALYGTWSDNHDMMARFGVTGQQSERSGFNEYHTGGGMRDVTLKTGVTVQLQPQISLQGGMRMYALTSGARRSPLTDNAVGAGFYLNALYQF